MTGGSGKMTIEPEARVPGTECADSCVDGQRTEVFERVHDCEMSACVPGDEKDSISRELQSLTAGN